MFLQAMDSPDQSFEGWADAGSVNIQWTEHDHEFDVELSSMGVHGFRYMVEANAMIIPKFIRGEPLTSSIDESFGFLGHIPASNGFPTIFIVFPS